MKKLIFGSTAIKIGDTIKFIFLLTLFISCTESPRFKRGDCVSRINDYEFKETYIPFYGKINSVGKKNYLVNYKRILFETSIYIIDKYYQKVSDAYCEDK